MWKVGSDGAAVRRRLWRIVGGCAVAVLVVLPAGAFPAAAERMPASGSGTAATGPVPFSHAARAAAPRSFRVTGVGPTSVALRWRAVRGARHYRIWRNGRPLANVRRTSYADRSARQLSSYTYQVAAVTGRVGRKSIPAPVTTRAAGGCDRYASTAGSDAGPGTAARPYRSVSRLVRSLRAGDVGCVSGAHAEDLTIDRGGSPGARIVLRSAPGQRARLRGRLWISDSADHVAVQDLDIDGRNLDNGDLPSPTIQGDDVLLLGNDITNRRWAICVILGSVRGYGQARGVVLDRNRIHDCGKRPANNHHHAIYVENAYGTRITNNVIYQSADRGIQLYPNAQNSLIARNVIDGNGQGVIFSGNHGYASSGNKVQDNVISNSRLRYNLEHWWPAGNPVGRRNLAQRNCLWGGRSGNVIERPVGFTVRGNAVARPRYRNRRGGDFRPASGSRCRVLLLGVAPLAPFAG